MDEPLLRAEKFRVERREVPTSSGGTRPREVVVSKDAVVVLPLLDDGRVVLIKNTRFAVGKTLWELPAGTLEPGEEPAVCAARELREEAGLAAGEVEALGRFHTSPGFLSELMHAFRATALEEVPRQLTETERIEVHPQTWDEVWALVRRGEIEDGKTLATLLLHRVDPAG